MSQTDRQTDRRLTVASPRSALASRGKKKGKRWGEWREGNGGLTRHFGGGRRGLTESCTGSGSNYINCSGMWTHATFAELVQWQQLVTKMLRVI